LARESLSQSTGRTFHTHKTALAEGSLAGGSVAPRAACHKGRTSHFLSQNLEDYLDRLQGQAQVDSSGVFTLDPLRARELLRDFALLEVEDSCLCFVSALIGLGATSLKVEQKGKVLVILAEGAHLSRELLANPLRGLFLRPSPAAERELALGLNACLAQARVQISSGEWVAHCSDSQFSVQARAPGPTRLQVEGLAYDLKRLSQHFAGSPAELTVQGRSLPSLGCTGSWRVGLLSQQEVAGSWRRQWESEVDFIHLHPAPLEVWIQPSSQPSARLQYLGRDYPLAPLWKGGPAVEVRLVCDRLDRDLGLAQLVENERHSQILEYVRQEWMAALEAMAESALQHQLPSRLWPLMGYCVECLAAAGQHSSALALQQAVHQGDSPVHNYRLQLLSGREPRLDWPRYLLKDLAELWRASRALRGPQHPETLRLVGLCLSGSLDEGQHALAVECFEHVQAPLSPKRRGEMALAYWEMGQLEAAHFHLQQALKQAEPGQWSTPLMEQLAEVQCQLGQPRAAAATLAELLRWRQQEYGQQSRRLGPLLSQLKLLCVHLGDAKLARHYQEWMDLLDQP
jgi:tetratricopeptide (TPR) repeat protein